MNMILNGNSPLFIQISEYIKIELITGQKKPGEKLPSVRDLAKTFQINPNTVQKAYQMLEDEGIIRSERGSGNYIIDDEQRIMSIKEEMLKEETAKYVNKMKSYGCSNTEIEQIIKKKLGV